MANDRMYLVNKITGKKIMLGKHYSMGWYEPSDDMSKRINEFFELNEEAFWEDPHAYEIMFESSCDKPVCTAKEESRLINHGLRKEIEQLKKGMSMNDIRAVYEGLTLQNQELLELTKKSVALNDNYNKLITAKNQDAKIAHLENQIRILETANRTLAAEEKKTKQKCDDLNKVYADLLERHRLELTPTTPAKYSVFNRVTGKCAFETDPWNLTSEAMPEDGERVLVACRFMHKTAQTVEHLIKSAHYCKGRGFCIDGREQFDNYWRSEVAAWRKMPDAPTDAKFIRWHK